MLIIWTVILFWNIVIIQSFGPPTSNNVRLFSSSRNKHSFPLHLSSSPIPSDANGFIDYLSHLIRNPLTFSSQGGSVDLESSPLLEAQVLNDLSHLASDLAVYITPATSYLRLAAFIGRILSLTSDYLEDYTILPEEFIFEHAMLFTTLGLLIKSVAPILQSSFVQTTEFDEDAYRMLFEPIGVSWTQYKSLKATSCIDWVTIDANTVLVNEHEAQAFKPSLIVDNATFASELGNLFRDSQENEAPSFNQTDYMYWLYRGEVSVSYDGKKYYDVTRTRGKYIDDPEALGFLADMRFLYVMDRNRRRKRLMELRRVNTKTKVKSHEFLGSFTPQSLSLKAGYTMATITVKNNEAILLRVNGTKLLQLMEDDEPLSNAVRLLLMMSLQRKIGALLRSGKEQQKNVYDLVSATDRFVFRERRYEEDSSSPDYFS